MSSGVGSTDLTLASTLDEVLGNRAGETVRVPLANALAVAAYRPKGYANKATLDANPGTTLHEVASVYDDATLANNGIYNWNGGGGWIKIGDLDTVTLEDRIDEVEASLTTEIEARVATSNYEPERDAIITDINSKLEIDTFTEYVQAAGEHFGILDEALDQETNAAAFFPHHRAGEWADWWTNEVPVGDPRTWDALDASDIAVGDEGAEVRVSGAGVIARRTIFAVEPGRIYRVRAVVERRSNPSDPAGDAVEIKIAQLELNKGLSSHLTLDTLTTLAVTDDRQEVVAYVGREAGTVGDEDVQVLASTTRYISAPYVQTFGTDGVTAVQVLDVVDITDVGSSGGSGGAVSAGDVTGLSESIDDRVAALIQDGTGISWVYDDSAGTLTPTVTGGGGGGVTLPVAITDGGTGATTAAAARTNLGLGTAATQASTAFAAASHTHTAANVTDFTEASQDVLGGLVADSATINATYDDAGGIETLAVIDNSSTQKVVVAKAGATIGTRSKVNFIEGGNVTITTADNSGSDRVDVTIAASGGGGGASPGVLTLTDAATINTNVTSGGNYYWDFTVTLAGTGRTLANPTGMTEVGWYTWSFWQDATGGRTVTAVDTMFDPSGALDLNTTASKGTIISGYYDGTKIRLLPAAGGYS
jgi:hypothetical protein